MSTLIRHHSTAELLANVPEELSLNMDWGRFSMVILQQ